MTQFWQSFKWQRNRETTYRYRCHKIGLGKVISTLSLGITPCGNYFLQQSENVPEQTKKCVLHIVNKKTVKKGRLPNASPQFEGISPLNRLSRASFDPPLAAMYFPESKPMARGLYANKLTLHTWEVFMPGPPLQNIRRCKKGRIQQPRVESLTPFHPHSETIFNNRNFHFSLFSEFYVPIIMS